ncbi:MAG: tRNA threonylcarbamoyladenosine dehydratase [Sarcina sp.]
MEKHWLSRTELVIGEEGIEKLKNAKIMILGVGGVGSFATEALTRVGIGDITIIDNDVVDITNINRQLHATIETVGKSKVQLMKERMLLINPQCKVTAKEVFITPNNLEELIPKDIDYIVDAIDNTTAKVALAVYCDKNGINLISSMGTGNKMDPSQFKVTDIYKTKVCPLAKILRSELKKRGVKKLKVVYSEEQPKKIPSVNGERPSPGSMAFVPPVSGMIMASQVVQELLR